MSWREAISWMGRSPSLSVRARSSMALMAYSPLAEILTRPASSLAPLLDEPRGVLREVGDDDVGPRPPDAREGLHDRPLLVQPPELARGADPAVLAGDRVRGHGQAEVALHARDDVQVRQRGLDHEDVWPPRPAHRHAPPRTT